MNACDVFQVISFPSHMMLGTFSVFLKKKARHQNDIRWLFFLNYKYSLVTSHFQEPLFSSYIMVPFQSYSLLFFIFILFHIHSFSSFGFLFLTCLLFSLVSIYKTPIKTNKTSSQCLD